MTKKLTRKEFRKLADSYYFETSWSNGGTWVNWNGDSGTYSPETPTMLTGHISFLEMYFPEVTIRTFVRIQDQVVTNTKNHSDYYGGETSDTSMHISIDDIARILIEDGFLEMVDEE